MAKSEKAPAPLSLQLCNLASTHGLKKACQIIADMEEKKEVTPITPGEPVKLTPKQKKAAIAEQIEALGGPVPDESKSVAVFEQALSAVKKIAETQGESNDLM